MTKSVEPKTYFEQVPLEIVKKIALPDPPVDIPKGGRVKIDPPGKG
jgi:hypothetical protein